MKLKPRKLAKALKVLARRVVSKMDSIDQTTRLECNINYEQFSFLDFWSLLENYNGHAKNFNVRSAKMTLISHAYPIL